MRDRVFVPMNGLRAFLVTAMLCSVVGSGLPRTALAACNLIPGTAKTFNSTLGATNRPFAAPDENVEIRLRPCDVGSPGLGAAPSDNVVTVVFTPPSGTPEAVILSSGDCSAINGQLAACSASLGGGNATCLPNRAIAVVEREGVRHLRFPFPDTDSSILAVADDITRAGPAKIAVSVPGEALPCGLATQTCAAQSGLRACIDGYFANDGACGTSTPLANFSSFTALPPPNNYRADCFEDSPPCTATATEVRAALDGDGNLLMPVDWSGVLVRNGGIPVPRLMRAQIKSPVPVSLEDAVFIGSYTPEGGLLPPIFEPQKDPSVTDPYIVSLFGSADAPYTILRFARRHGQCTGGGRNGLACSNDTDCPGGSCPATCVGAPSSSCGDDADCGVNGPCGRNFDFDVIPEVPSGGALVLDRSSTNGMCQENVALSCAADCGGNGPCVNYAYEGKLPVPLDGFRASSLAHSFASLETIDGIDRNGDGDLNDSVVTFRDRATGRAQDFGKPGECGGGSAEGRSVMRTVDLPYRFPVVETEADHVAFFESEAYQACDVNGDGDQADGVVRAFDLDGNELTASVSPPRVGSMSRSVQGKQLAFSSNRLFVRSSEAGMAARVSERVSLDPSGNQFTSVFPNCTTNNWGVYIDPDINCTPAVSGDGRYIAFLANDLGAVSRLYVRDRNLDTTTLIDQAIGDIDISPDGRYLSYVSTGPHSLGGRKDTIVHDRVSGTFENISQSLPPISPWAADESSGTARISDDGRYVLFYNGGLRRADRCVSNGVAVPGCTPTMPILSPIFEIVSGPPKFSGDGRYVAANFFNTSAGYHDWAVVWDAEAGVQIWSSGGEVPYQVPLFSSDGFIHGGVNYTGYASPNPFFEITVRDWRTGAERVLNSITGADSDSPSATLGFSFGRSGLVAMSGDAGTALFAASNVIWTRDLRQLTTGVLPVVYGGLSSPLDAQIKTMTLSDDGEVVVVTTAATNLLAPGEDTNGGLDVYVYSADDSDPMGIDTLLFPNGSLSDNVLEVFDTNTSTMTTLCPAEDVAVVDGKAAFLRPESPAGTATCPAGSLNGDGDTSDLVVQLWPGSGSPLNLGRAASAVAISSSHVGALVSESENGTDYNSDGDQLDDVVQSHDQLAVPGTWHNTGQAASSVKIAGDVAVFLTPEASQGAADLNGDGDAADRVLQAYDVTAGSLLACSPEMGAACTAGVRQPAAEFVVGEETVTHCGTVRLVAFRTTEAEAGNTDLNGDGDSSDGVLQVYDLVGGTLQNTSAAVTPCAIPECDPTTPYKVEGGKIRFLTFEPDQGNQDLTGDGNLGLALQLYDFCNDVTTVIGAVKSGDGDSDPLLENQDSVVLTIDGKRCRFASPADCNATPCPEGSYCDGTCVARSPQTCQADSECPAGSTCVGEVVIGATAIEDFDDDGVPNDQDNCVSTPNTNQNDLDQDLVGDACDLQTCQNAVLETIEECDDGNFVGADACTDLCRFNVCGDGFVYPGFEECDHGSVSTNNECLPGCILNTCGDGVVHIGVEPCDDGNASDSDACVPGCVLNVCGDGHLNVGVEQCDDGAGNDDGAIDACRTNCMPASCGDGVIDSVDGCDDGNLVAGDGCDAACLREHPDPYQPLPDSTEPFTYTESRVDVTTACPIVGVSVVLDIDHSSVGDLTLDLSYGAATVRLLDRPGIAVPDPATGGYDGNLAGVYTFADGGSAFPQAGGVRVHPSTYAPEGLRRTGGGGTLSDFNGLTSGGEWTLNLVDAGGTGSGALFRWQVIAEISCETTFTFSQTSGSPIGPDPVTYTTPALNVPDSILIQRLGVSVDLTHSSLGDLAIDVSHGATTGRLVNQQGGYDNGWWANDDFGGSYLFRDNAGPFVWDLDGDVLVPPGLYSAEGSLRGFIGADAAGSWTLTIRDRGWGDGGTLNSWSILVTGTGPQAAAVAVGPQVSCGDGRLASSEVCDDGNDNDGDGCTRRCVPSSPEMAKCQGALGKMNSVYLTTRLKRLQACRNDLNQGKLLFTDEAETSPVATPEDCGSEFDTVAAMAKLAGKIRAKVTKACGSTLLPQLSACASTVDGLIAADGLSGCLVVENNAAADDMLDDAYGRGLTSAEESENSCQQKIASSARKYAAARLKALGKCRDLLAKGKPPYLDAAKTTLVTNPAQCELAIAAEESMAKAGQKLRSSIADPDTCSDALVASLTSACATTIDGLVNAAGDGGCLIAGIEAGTDRNIGAAYDFLDVDGDGWSDLADNCPSVANPTQADGDGDGIADACDNCANMANAGQANADGDAAGDDCDEDADGDGVANAYDNCPTTANADQTDTPSVLAIFVDGSSTDVVEPFAEFYPRYSNAEGPLRFDNIILACGACATSTLIDVNMDQVGGGMFLCGRSTQLLKYLAESGQPMCARSFLTGRNYDLVFKSFKGSRTSCFGPGCAAAGNLTSYLRSDGIGDACAP